MNEDFNNSGFPFENTTPQPDVNSGFNNETPVPPAPDFQSEPATNQAPEQHIPLQQIPVQDVPTQEPTIQNDTFFQSAPQQNFENNAYVWNVKPEIGNKKPLSSGRIFLRVVIAILAVAIVILAGFEVANLVNDIGGTTNNTVSSQSSVEQKEGFTINDRTEEDELSVTQVASSIRPAVVGVVNYSLNSLTASGYGSGVVINSEGYVVTNYHVIEGADRVKVVLYNEKEALASIIGYDEQTDLAVLKIIEDENVKYSDLTVATFGNSDQLQLAETVIAIGNPGGLEFAGTVTRGIVSGLNVKTDLSGSVNLIQTDAAINPGNSGGPLIDLYGNVIGITSQKIVDTEYEGMGFAIPSNTVKPIVDNIITYGYVPGRPMLGITGSDIDEYVAYFNNVPQGVLISSVDETSDIYKKGIKKNDIITSFNGTTIKTMDELNTEKEKYKAGDTVEIGIYRYSEGKSFTVKVQLSEYKPE